MPRKTMDFQILRWSHVETIQVRPEPCVAISAHFESAQRLYDIVKNTGEYTPLFTSEKWPRDKLHAFGKRAVVASERLKEGGHFVWGRDYGLTSRRDRSAREQRECGRMDSTVYSLEEFYGVPIYQFPSEKTRSSGGGGHNHIDCKVLVLSQRDIIFVDRHMVEMSPKEKEFWYGGKRDFPYYGGIDPERREKREKSIERRLELLEQTGSTIIPLPEQGLLPFNSLVLQTHSGPLVITEKSATILQSELKNMHIDFETIAAHTSAWHGGGGVRCRTNVLPSIDLCEYGFPIISKKREITRCKQEAQEDLRRLQYRPEPY